jgi:hypothetical protein
MIHEELRWLDALLATSTSAPRDAFRDATVCDVTLEVGEGETTCM